MTFLGQKIKELRTEKKLTQEAVGRILGVSRQAINQWEKEQTTPRIKRIYQLAKVLNCQLKDLLNIE